MEHVDVVLRVKDIRLDLGRPILGGVSFDVRNRTRPGVQTGQIIGILGPSGVGKTKLLRIIAGLDRPDHGSVTSSCLGLSVGQVRYVFQAYPMLPHRTVRGNLEVAARGAGLRRGAARDRAQELLSLFELERVAGLYPRQVSGGQRQRAAIAQQLACPQKLLLLDEPFSGLDMVAAQEVAGLLASVVNQHDHNTILLVTHELRAALAVSDTLHLLGRDRDSRGDPVDGARIQSTYDLVERGLAWHPKVSEQPAFRDLEREIGDRFRLL